MSAPADLYPLSTQDAKSIPLDVIDVLSYVRIVTSTSATVDVTLPDLDSLLILYATEDTLVSFEDGLAAAPVVNGTFYADTLLVPSLTLITAIPKSLAMKVLSLGASAGVLHIQLARKWAGLALARQTNKF